MAAEFFKFNIGGMTCSACTGTVATAIQAATQKYPSAKICVHLPTHTATIEINETHVDRNQVIKNVIDELSDLGFTCEESKETATENRANIRNHIIKGVVGLSVGAIILALTLSGVGIPFAAMVALIGISSALTIYLGWESYSDAAKKLVKAGTLTMDTLFTISTLTIIGVSIASIFVPWLPMMIEAGVLIFGFRHVGKAIEKSLEKKVSSGLTFADRGAKKVRRFKDNEWQEITADLIEVDDIISVQAGDVIPVNGTALTDTLIYNTITTGSTTAAKIRKDTPICAGMAVPTDVPSITLKATRTTADSYLKKLDENIAKAVTDKAPIVTGTEKLLNYFIPAVLAFAAIAGIVIGAVVSPALALQCVASLLASACPCIFGMIPAYSIQIGMSKASEHGVKFINDSALEQADSIDTIVFDLNGTLTLGEPKVAEMMILPDTDITPEDFYGYLHALESQSTHRVANAILDAMPTDYKPLDNTNMVMTAKRSGITATINGEAFFLGNEQLLQEHDITALPPLSHTEDSQVIYLARGKQILGYVVLKDPLRQQAKFTIRELQQDGKEIHLCTGADNGVALRYARMLNIPEKNIRANCVDKVAYIESLQKQGKKVSMVGDAGNDAVAVPKSDFGIAIKSAHGDIITQDNAMAVIDTASLAPVVTTFKVARQTMRNIKFNLGFSIAYNLTTVVVTCAILLAIGFALNPAIGAALMVLQAALILSNLYRIKHQQLEHLPRLNKELLAGPARDEDTGSSYRLYRSAGLCQQQTVSDKASSEQPAAAPQVEEMVIRPTPGVNYLCRASGSPQ